MLPSTIPTIADREEQSILITPDPLLILGLLDTADDVDVACDLLAERVEGEIVHVVAEGVFELGADEKETEDEVGGEDGAGNGDPFELGVELEGEEHDVDVGHLGDGDRVGDWKGRVEDTLCASENVVEGGEHVVCGILR